jgi:hypothetical protein
VFRAKKEDLLPVIFSMLELSKEDQNRVLKSRKQLNDKGGGGGKDGSKKGGVLGLFGNKK